MLEFDIQKRLGDFHLNAQLSAPNGVTVLFGPSGSGKTSIINAVAGLLHPDQGRIMLNGVALFGDQANLAPHSRDIGYVFQDARLFPHMTVLQNLRYGGRHKEVETIDLLGLRPLLTRRPKDLSGGEKQRVALGRALMRNPKVLLLDEPLAALDGKLKAEILPYFEDLRDNTDLPILYVTHSMSEVARLATTLALVHEGRIIRTGPVAEVLADPDTVPMIGVREAGAVIETTIQGQGDQLTTLGFDGGTLTLPGDLGPVGQTLRLRIPAQDVILSLDKPTGLSALNILPVKITKLTHGKGPGVAVGLTCGETPILARVTSKSAQTMGLSVGQDLYAILKATAVGPADIGARRQNIQA